MLLQIFLLPYFSQMGASETIRIFQAVPKTSVHGGMAEQDGSCQHQLLISARKSSYSHRNPQTFVMKKVIQNSAHFGIENITDHAQIRQKK